MQTLTRLQSRELDRRAMVECHMPGLLLMENAGRSCSEWILAHCPQRTETIILCGPGNNGGDGYVIARHLDNAGWPVQVWLFVEEHKLIGDAEAMFRILKTCGIPISRPREELPANALYIDALFGTGLTRPLSGETADFIQRLNSEKRDVVAVDLPSGLDSDTGLSLGTCVKAKQTLTFVLPKAGFTNPASGEWSGEIHIMDIGVPKRLLDID